MNVDDIVETTNHFRAIDYIIDNTDSKLTEKFIKELHRLLKSGTSDERKSWFRVGEYKNCQMRLEATTPRFLKMYIPKSRNCLRNTMPLRIHLLRISLIFISDLKPYIHFRMVMDV